MQHKDQEYGFPESTNSVLEDTNKLKKTWTEYVLNFLEFYSN